jgi:hypothetical protein
MFKPGKLSRGLVLGGALAAMTLSSGCTLVDGFAQVQYAFSLFWETTPLIPVSAYFSQQIEDTYWEEERYKRVPILDPIEGEHAPLFCMDPPSPDEVMRALPDESGGGMYFLAETQRNNVRIVVEPAFVDRVDECRFYPMVGPARLHHCHYKCHVYYEKVLRSDWPVPFTHVDQTHEVVYIDHDHLIRCAGPVVTGPLAAPPLVP